MTKAKRVVLCAESRCIEDWLMCPTANSVRLRTHDRP